MTDLDFSTIKKLPDVLTLSELLDQIIVATALLYEAKVLTKDQEIKDSGLVVTVW